MSFEPMMYQDILGTLQEWGAVFQVDLYELVNDGKSLQNFQIRIKKLLKEKALDNSRGGYNSNEKILFLDKEFQRKSLNECLYVGDQYTAAHDAFCSRFVKFLMENDLVSEYCFEHSFGDLSDFQFDDDLFVPDAIVNTVKPRQTFFIEVELNLKSRFRLRRKLKRIADTQGVSNVVYIVTSKLVFNALKSEVANLKNTDSGKFFVLFVPNWGLRKTLLDGSILFNLKGRSLFGVSPS